MAISNSNEPVRPVTRWRRRSRLIAATLAGVALAMVSTLALAVSSNTVAQAAAARAHRLYREARAHFEQHGHDAAAGWQFGRACFDWAEFAADSEQRAAIAQEGIAACRRAAKLDARLCPARYYLAMNLGQLARTKTLGALKLITEMETAFQQAIELDAGFDYAGPHRSLGILYLEAPGWPASIGHRGKAKQHLEKSVALSPDYPDNWLNLLEAHLKWGERQAAADYLAKVEGVLAAAREKLAGEAWALSWLDWDRRWEQVKARVAMSAKAQSSKLKAQKNFQAQSPKFQK